MSICFTFTDLLCGFHFIGTIIVWQGGKSLELHCRKLCVLVGRVVKGLTVFLLASVELRLGMDV